MKKNILVISNTIFSITKFRQHYLSKLSKIYNLEIYTPDCAKLSNRKNLFFKKLGFNNFLSEFFIIRKILKKDIDLLFTMALFKNCAFASFSFFENALDKSVADITMAISSCTSRRCSTEYIKI